MELGISSSDFYSYGIISLLFSLCIIYPPQEFSLAGFTIPKIFYFLLGNERFDFVEYQLRRIALNIFVHASLPLSKFLKKNFNLNK